MSIKIITTEDGSHSLLDEGLNETYHSTRGAKGESMHVFIKEGLEYWHSRHQAEEIRILEVGFGTGLNGFLTALMAEEKQLKTHFFSLEPFPIREEVYNKLNYHISEAESELFRSLHRADWEKEGQVSDYFTLHKSTAKLEDFETSAQVNLIYFDAFAPNKQPEVWRLENLQKCFHLLTEGGALTTYCAQGQFKRDLKAAGFEVQTLQGAMGKKEMVRGIKH